MNWDAVAAIAEALGAAGVIITLLYLAAQIRTNTRVVRTQSRHQISEFIQHLSEFRATHADRLARIETADELTPGDQEFQAWAHAQVLLLGETYHYHHELGMMPTSHWRGFVRFFRGYTQSKGFDEAWERFADSMAEEFTEWVNEQRAELAAAAAPTGAPTHDS